MIPARKLISSWMGCLLLGAVALGFCAVEAGALEEPSDDDIAALIVQLGHPDFVVRDRAQRKLGELGEKAYNALSIAANHSDLEVAARARYLLRSIELPVIRDTDSERVKELLEDYLDLPMVERIERVQSLMELSDGQGYRAACRLVQVESSDAMSKYIAIMILNRWPVHQRGRTLMQEAAETELKGSGRTAARWLVAFGRADADPKSDLTALREAVDEEESLLAQRSPSTTVQTVGALLYVLAFAEAGHNEPDAARRSIERVGALEFAETSAAASLRFQMARYFRFRGMLEWAAEAYGEVSKLGNANATSLSQWDLADMYHDAGRNEAAAAALQRCLEASAGPLTTADVFTPEQIRGRLHFIRACHANDSGDKQKYRTELFEAVKNDPDELDALIALYNIDDLEEAARKNVLAMINVAADRQRQQAQLQPEEASAHNQLAWLVGNTTGDMDEALKHALRAVELRPESGAYLDTLAHVYFYGLKEYDKAVETQAKAVEFMPYSGLIREKYELFRKETR